MGVSDHTKACRLRVWQRQVKAERVRGIQYVADKTTDPEPPHPFWRWNWRSASWGSRAWFVYRGVAKPLFWMAGIIGAIVIVGSALPRVDSSVRWRNKEYEELRSIHAGYDQDLVTQEFGVATMTRSVGKADEVERIYVRREHYVQVVSDKSGRVELYSVTACKGDFRPKFDAD